MAKSKLDASQIIQSAFDDANGAIRTIPGTLSSYALQLDANSGDSIRTVADSITQKVSITNANSGVILMPFSIIGLRTISLTTNTISDITDQQVCTLQISPSDTDDVWSDTSLTITADATTGVVVAGSEVSVCARRARVTIADAITSGSFDLYVVGLGAQ